MSETKTEQTAKLHTRAIIYIDDWTEERRNTFVAKYANPPFKVLDWYTGEHMIIEVFKQTPRSPEANDVSYVIVMEQQLGHAGGKWLQIVECEWGDDPGREAEVILEWIKYLKDLREDDETERWALEDEEAHPPYQLQRELDYLHTIAGLI